MKKNTKKEYVLNQPSDVSAEELVKKAQEEGIKLTKAYVYNIRSASKSKPKAKKSITKQIVRVAPLPLAKAKRVEPPVVVRDPSMKSADLAADLFVQAIDALVADRVHRALSRLAGLAQ